MSLPQPLSGARNISLETYRKSGAPVKTTVWLVHDGGSLFVRTDSRSGKVKRLRNNPHVRLAPSDMRGKVKGDWVEGEARFVEDSRADEVLRLFRKKYGLAIPLIALSRRLRGFPQLVVIEITVAS